MEKKIFYENYASEHFERIGPGSRETVRENAAESLLRSLPSSGAFLNPKSHILDLGCGSGNLTFLCKTLGILHYTGIDISAENVAICRADFPEYTFLVQDILSVLMEPGTHYDVVLMSHVLEHFTLTEAFEIVRMIRTRLRPGGVFLNIMPNAHAYFHSTSVLYSDLTHERLYSPLSFSHLLRKAGWENFQHYNYKIGGSRVRKFLHKIARIAFETFLRILGYDTHTIYTSSMITIAESVQHIESATEKGNASNRI